MKAPVSEDLRSEIQQLRAEGLSYARIAKRLEIATTTARRYGGSQENAPPEVYDLEKINEQADRCPGCGRKVILPCRACQHENPSQEENPT